MKKKPLTDKHGEVRELTQADLKGFRPAGDALPPALTAILPKRKPGQRGPQRKPTKDQITLRLDHDLVEHFKAGGPGWQSRINSALRRIVSKAGGLTHVRVGSSPYSLYDMAVVSMDDDEGAYQPTDAIGFIALNALPLKMAHRQAEAMAKDAKEKGKKK